MENIILPKINQNINFTSGMTKQTHIRETSATFFRTKEQRERELESAVESIHLVTYH